MSDLFAEDESTAIHRRVEEWYDAFEKSPAFAALTESQQNKAGAIANYFTDHCHRHLDLAPAQWHCNAVRDCCLEILPRKVSAELSFFEAIAPVLGAFFRFLGDQSLHPTKTLVMAAHEAGVNIGDQAEFNAFIAAYNIALASRFKSSDPPPAAPPSSGNPYASCPCGSGKKFKFCCRQTQADQPGAPFSTPRWL